MSDFPNQPWTVSHDLDGSTFDVLDSNGVNLAALYYGFADHEGAPVELVEVERRAHLFKAAPALLAALERLEWCRRSEHRGTACCDAMRTASAAVALARGGQP